MADQYSVSVLARIPRPKVNQSRRTPQRAVAIGSALMAGASREAAAGHAGVSYTTLWRWMNAEPEMAALVFEAESKSQVALVTRIYNAGATTWQAAAWLLERRWPREFGRRNRMDATVDTRAIAESIAEETGQDADQLIAEAQAMLAEHRERLRRASL